MAPVSIQQDKGLFSMMSMRTKRSGFSLVELVIVVVIIGVIAAIAVPRISRGAKGAGDSAVRASLAGLRNAIDMFAAEHSGNFPTGVDQAELESRLISKTDSTGVISATAADNIYGPYLRSGFPALPVCANKGSTVVDINTTGEAAYNSGTEGWVYSTVTGKVIANCADAEEDDNGVKYNTY